MARRKQRGVAATERLFSYSYGVFACYGDSIGLPLLWLACFGVVFSVVFLVADIGSLGVAKRLPVRITAQVDSDHAEAIKFSLSRIFPFGAFEGTFRQWLDSFDARHGNLAEILVRVAATIESFLSLTLALTFGLAVRRTFQIS
ncbi:MAG: hypothetical protein ABW199_09855 [Caulobacterales bacterium]